MNKLVITLLMGIALLPAVSLADSWFPAQTETILSANGKFRVTVVPRPLEGALAYFSDKVDGIEPAGQDPGEAQRSPVARVERLADSGEWEFVWQMPLVNNVAPVVVLLADDGSRLVTFDNWHSKGYGDDAVVIYDRQGEVVRKFSLEQMLPADYVRHLPRSVSSLQWRGTPALVDGDRMVEIPVAQPRPDREEWPELPLRVRLSDGQVMVPASREWLGALARAGHLEAARRDAWDALRELRVTPLLPPGSADTREWRTYLFELRDRIEADNERMGGMLLAAPGEERHHDAGEISDWIAFHGDEFASQADSFIFASPTSDRLAAILVDALQAREPGSMASAHIVFVGTPAEGERVAQAARRAGARITLVDPSIPVPPGHPLPVDPDPRWMAPLPWPWGPPKPPAE